MWEKYGDDVRIINNWGMQLNEKFTTFEIIFSMQIKIIEC